MTTLSEGAYWRLKCLIAEATAEAVRLDLVTHQAKWHMAQAADAARTAMLAAGLDPSQNYRWTDETHSVEAVP